MKDIESYIESNRERILRELSDLLAIPSVSSQSEHRPDMQACTEWLAAHLRRIGLDGVEILQTGGHPVVYAERLRAPGAPTVLIYGHYDVQPVDPLDLWTSPPFQADIRGGRLYARGASDDKGQLFIHIKAVEALLARDEELPINVKFLFEGEEEIGSGNLEKFIRRERQRLRADIAVISDSSMWAKGRPTICYGLRGLCAMQVEVSGPGRDLHSGSFGGSVHNPIQALSEIIAALHDRNGRITVKGFYDAVRRLTPAERAAFAALPYNERAYMKEVGVGRLHGEKGYSTYERIWARPTLECNGIWGGYSGEGIKTVLPARAAAKISMRLVPDQDSRTIALLFEQHIKKLAPPTVSVTVKLINTGEPAIVPLDSPAMNAAAAAVKKSFARAPIFKREGGSIPVVVQLKHILGIDTILLGFGLPEENAHSPNEFLDLDNFHAGIKTCALLYEELAAVGAKALRSSSAAGGAKKRTGTRPAGRSKKRPGA